MGIKKLRTEDQNRPHVIGITGKIASGKSTVADFFRQKHYPVFDSDKAGRELQENDPVTQAKIKQAFANLAKEGMIDRQKLRAEVLKDLDSLIKMEEIIFPAVKAKAELFIQAHPEAPLIILEVPLLWSSGINALCDEIFYIECPPKCRAERMAKRGFLSPEMQTLIEMRQKQEEACLDKTRDEKIFYLRGDAPLENTELLVNTVLKGRGSL